MIQMSEADTGKFQVVSRRKCHRNSGQNGSSVDKSKQVRSKSPSSTRQTKQNQGTTLIIKGVRGPHNQQTNKICRAMDKSVQMPEPKPLKQSKTKTTGSCSPTMGRAICTKSGKFTPKPC
jgi:hypothetical protein